MTGNNSYSKTTCYAICSSLEWQSQSAVAISNENEGADTLKVSLGQDIVQVGSL